MSPRQCKGTASASEIAKITDKGRVATQCRTSTAYTATATGTTLVLWIDHAHCRYLPTLPIRIPIGDFATVVVYEYVGGCASVVGPVELLQLVSLRFSVPVAKISGDPDTQTVNTGPARPLRRSHTIHSHPRSRAYKSVAMPFRIGRNKSRLNRASDE